MIPIDEAKARQIFKQELDAKLRELGLDVIRERFNSEHDFLTGRHKQFPGSIQAGLICMWSGRISEIPNGWYLCDGNNGTPDLRDKFVVGASADSEGVAKTTVAGAASKSGGATTHTHAAHAAHVFTQPSGHTISAHAGCAVADHGALSHAGATVADHAAVSHAGCAVAAHNVDAFLEGPSGGFFAFPGEGDAAHSVTQANNHAAESHTVGQASNHAAQSHGVTQPGGHDALAHSGGAVNAHSAHDSPNHLNPYYALAFVQKG